MQQDTDTKDTSDNDSRIYSTQLQFVQLHRVEKEMKKKK